MSRRKIRPALGAPVTADMSLRDKAAALGTSVGQLYRWMRLSELPTDEFERRLFEQGERRAAGGPAVTTESIIRDAPFPEPERVGRALALVRSMTDLERGRFLRGLERVIGVAAIGSIDKRRS